MDEQFGLFKEKKTNKKDKNNEFKIIRTNLKKRTLFYITAYLYIPAAFYNSLPCIPAATHVSWSSPLRIAVINPAVKQSPAPETRNINGKIKIIWKLGIPIKNGNKVKTYILFCFKRRYLVNIFLEVSTPPVTPLIEPLSRFYSRLLSHLLQPSRTAPLYVFTLWSLHCPCLLSFLVSFKNY